jgi:hypothetical protein
VLCPICRESANDITPPDNTDRTVVECPGCGTFEISNSTVAIFEKTDEASRRAALNNAKVRAALGERPLVLSSEHPAAVEQVGTETAFSDPHSTEEKMSRVFTSIVKSKGNVRLYLVISTLWVIGALIYAANNNMGDEQLLTEAINTVGDHCNMPTTTYEACVSNTNITRTLLGRDADDLLLYRDVNSYEDYKRVRSSFASVASGVGLAETQQSQVLDDKQLRQDYAEVKKKLDAQKARKKNEQRLSEKKCKEETDTANSNYERCMSEFGGRVNARRAEIERHQSAFNLLAVTFVPVIVPLFAAICVVVFFFFQGILKWVSEGYKNDP